MAAQHLIFAEPPSEVGGSWVHGAMLGGMVGYDNESLSRSYFAAAHALVGQVLATKARGQDFICPVLYLYRHGTELYLKVITEPKKLNHNLADLMAGFREHVRNRYGQVVPQSFSAPIEQLAEFDERSDTFRYGTNAMGQISFTSGRELWIDLRGLRKTMSRIELGFRRVLVADQFGIQEVNFVGPTRPEYQ